MKTDYFEEIKGFLLENYEPVDSPNRASDYTERKTLDDVHKEVCGVLPSDWVYKSDVYQVLLELGFKTFSYFIKEELDIDTGKVVVKAEKKILYFMDKKTAAI